MATHKAAARSELWRRFDAGEVLADELEARLQLLDRAGDDDEAAIAAAVSAAVPIRRRRSTRRLVVALAGLLALVAGAGGVVALAGALDGDGSSGSGNGAAAGFEDTFAAGGPVVAVPGVVAPVPAPPVECTEAERLRDEPTGTEAPADPEPFSDPPVTPEGYDVAVERESIAPGNDFDLAMSSAAGNPLPVEVWGRDLTGELVVRMRTFVYGDADQAVEAAATAAQTGCSFGAEFSETDDGIGLAVVRNAGIPTTVFASWRLEERRFIVAVEPAGDEDERIGAARTLAVEIASAEREAALAAR